MTVKDVVARLPVSVVAGESLLERQIRGGYVGDLLSVVMARASSGNVWVTVQGHPNVVAVAVLVGISAVIVAEGARIEPGTLERADREGIPVLSSAQPAFDLVAQLAAMGVKGSEC